MLTICTAIIICPLFHSLVWLMHKESESHLTIFQMNISLQLSARPPASLMWVTARRLRGWFWGRKLCHPRLSRSQRETGTAIILGITQLRYRDVCRVDMLPFMLQFWPSTGLISRLTADYGWHRILVQEPVLLLFSSFSQQQKTQFDISIQHTSLISTSRLNYFITSAP